MKVAVFWQIRKVDELTMKLGILLLLQVGDN